MWQRWRNRIFNIAFACFVVALILMFGMDRAFFNDPSNPHFPDPATGHTIHIGSKNGAVAVYVTDEEYKPRRMIMYAVIGLAVIVGVMKVADMSLRYVNKRKGSKDSV